MTYGEKITKKCKACPYILGYVKTLVDLCPTFVGETSIFASYPTTKLTINMGF